MSPSIEPFNEAKYKALMDGLECSEINYKDVLTGSYSARLDSDFYKKYAIAFSKISENWELLSVICPHITSGTTPKDRDDDLKEGVILFKTNDIRNNIQSSALNTQYYYIDLETDRKMSSSSIQGRDVLINIVGASTDVIGRVAFVPKNFDRANITQAMARLRVEKDDIMPEYLFVFLMTSFAKSQTNRIARQTEQYNMNLTEVGTFRVWKPTMEFQKYISKIVSQADISLHNGQKAYLEGEAILSDNLPKCEKRNEKAVAVRTLSSSFLQSGRLDAEYYQPKYDEYFKILHGFETTNIPTEFDVYKNSGTNYAIEANDIGVIKTKQLGNRGIDTDGVESYFAIQTCIDSKSTFLKNNDVVFASMGVGSLGKISLFSYDGDKQFVTDSTLRVYRAKLNCRVQPEVLCVFLQSWIGQELIYRYVVGSTGIINIYEGDMAKIPIPVFKDPVQNEIAAHVQQSFALRRKSKQLLVYAKQAVEMAIEQGEDVALEWLKTKEGEM